MAQRLRKVVPIQFLRSVLPISYSNERRRFSYEQKSPVIPNNAFTSCCDVLVSTRKFCSGSCSSAWRRSSVGGTQPYSCAAEDRQGRHRMDADLSGIGFNDDDSRVVSLLRWFSSKQKCPRDNHAQLHHSRLNQHTVGAVGVQLSLWARPGRDNR